jgi:hypothetical protein
MGSMNNNKGRGEAKAGAGTQCPASLNTYHKVVFVSGVFFDFWHKHSLVHQVAYSGTSLFFLLYFFQSTIEKTGIRTELTIRTFGYIKSHYSGSSPFFLLRFFQSTIKRRGIRTEFDYPKTERVMGFQHKEYNLVMRSDL